MPWEGSSSPPQKLPFKYKTSACILGGSSDTVTLAAVRIFKYRYFTLKEPFRKKKARKYIQLYFLGSHVQVNRLMYWDPKSSLYPEVSQKMWGRDSGQPPNAVLAQPMPALDCRTKRSFWLGHPGPVLILPGGGGLGGGNTCETVGWRPMNSMTCCALTGEFSRHYCFVLKQEAQPCKGNSVNFRAC